METIEYIKGGKIYFDKLIINVFIKYCYTNYIDGVAGFYVLDERVLNPKADNSKAIERASEYLKDEVKYLKDKYYRDYDYTFKNISENQKIFGKSGVFNILCKNDENGEFCVKDEYKDVDKFLSVMILCTKVLNDLLLKKIIERTKEKLGIETITEPQQIKPPQNHIRQFTDEQIDILKSYFVSTFKGMGNSANYFDENLLIDLKKDREGIAYAKIAKLIYESERSVKGFKTKPFSKWYETFCNLMGIKKCQYRISRIIIDNTIKSEFYYL